MYLVSLIKEYRIGKSFIMATVKQIQYQVQSSFNIKLFAQIVCKCISLLIRFAQCKRINLDSIKAQHDGVEGMLLLRNWKVEIILFVTVSCLKSLISVNVDKQKYEAPFKIGSILDFKFNGIYKMKHSLICGLLCYGLSSFCLKLHF